MLKCNYIVKGVIEEGDMMKLLLSSGIISNKIGLSDLTDIEGLQQRTTLKMKRLQDPDKIRISIEDYKDLGISVGSVIEISIRGGE